MTPDSILPTDVDLAASDPDVLVLDSHAVETPSSPASSVSPDALPAPTRGSASSDLVASTMELLSDVELEVTVELGRRRIALGEVARLSVGSVVELDTLAGEPLVVYANGRRIATGEAVVVDGHFGVRIHALASGARGV